MLHEFPIAEGALMPLGHIIYISTQTYTHVLCILRLDVKLTSYTHVLKCCDMKLNVKLASYTQPQS